MWYNICLNTLNLDCLLVLPHMRRTFCLVIAVDSLILSYVRWLSHEADCHSVQVSVQFEIQDNE